MRVLVARLIAVLALAATALAQPADRPSADGLARRLQANYDRVRDFTADFVQTYESGVLRKRVVERGTLRVKKPGKMRWEYTSPEKKLFVSDGVQLYSYLPADRQVYVSPVPPEDQATTAALFLAGKGDLARDFAVTYADPGATPPGTYALRLAPRQSERDYDWLALVVDRGTLETRSLVAADRQGGTSTFEFANFRENVGLADQIFVFKIPRGVDVIRTGNSPG